MTNTTGLTSVANFEEAVFTEDMILQWAQADTGGGLPAPSALAFASWLDSTWNDYDDGTDKQTNQDVLTGALAHWTGGPDLVPTPELKQAYKAAEAAHAALYDPSLGDEWRRGPYPVKLADFFAELSATGILAPLKD